MYNKRLIIIVQKTQDTAQIRDGLAAIIAAYTGQSEDDERLTLGKAVQFERVANPGVVFALATNIAITDDMEAPLKTFFLDTVSANRRIYEVVNKEHTATYQGETRNWFRGQLLRVLSVVNDVQDVVNLSTLDNTQYATEPVTWQDVQDDLLADFGIQIMQPEGGI